MKKISKNFKEHQIPHKIIAFTANDENVSTMVILFTEHEKTSNNLSKYIPKR